MPPLSNVLSKLRALSIAAWLVWNAGAVVLADVSTRDITNHNAMGAFDDTTTTIAGSLVTRVLSSEIDDLPVIEVTLPAGINTNDENIADVINGLISPQSTTKSQQEEQQPLESPSNITTSFRMEFHTEEEWEFSDNELLLIQTVFEMYTIYFAPLASPEDEWKITTRCTIDGQTLLDPNNNKNRDRNLEKDKKTRRESEAAVPGEPDPSTIALGFTMTYESAYYDVTMYPELFQGWITNNLEVLLEQFQFLNIPVVGLGVPEILSEPMLNTKPSRDERKGTRCKGFYCDPPPVPRKDLILAAVLPTIMLIIAFTIMVLGIAVYLRKQEPEHRRGSDDDDDDDDEGFDGEAPPVPSNQTPRADNRSKEEYPLDITFTMDTTESTW